MWTHFVTHFSGLVFALLWGYPFLVQGDGRSPQQAAALLTLLVLAAIGVGPLLGHLIGRWPYRRSVPALAVVGASATAWAIVLAWPGRAPLALLVVLVLVLATNGPGSMIGFDYARTFNPPNRLGTATGVVNVGGFVASLLSIELIGLILDARTGGSAAYDIGDFKVAMSVQYVFMAIGLIGILRTRRLARRRMAEEGVVVRPLREVLAERRGLAIRRQVKGKTLQRRN